MNEPRKPVELSESEHEGTDSLTSLVSSALSTPGKTYGILTRDGAHQKQVYLSLIQSLGEKIHRANALSHWIEFENGTRIEFYPATTGAWRYQEFDASIELP